MVRVIEVVGIGRCAEDNSQGYTQARGRTVVARRDSVHRQRWTKRKGEQERGE